MKPIFPNLVPSYCKNVIEIIRRMSISKKFVIIYVTVFAIPIFFYALFSFHNANEDVKAEFFKQSREQLAKVYDNIQGNINACRKATTAVSSLKSFRKFVNGNMLKDDLELVSFRYSEYTLMEDIISSNPDISNISFYMDNPNIYEIWNIVLSETRITDKEFVTCLKKMDNHQLFRLCRIQNKLNSNTDEKEIGLYTELRDGRTYEGVLEVNMYHKTFFKDLYQNKDDGNSFLMLVGNENPKEYVMDKGSEFFKERENVFNMILESIARNAVSGRDTCRFRVQEENFVVNYMPVTELNAYIYSIYSLKGVTEKLDSVRNDILTGFFIAIILLCLITYVLTTLLLKRLNKVVSTIRKVQTGNFNVTIPVKGNDEIDELASHFNHMLLKVKDLISELVKKQLTVKDAELKALQSQINSHFIYNVLESIRMLAEVEKKRAIADAITSLGKLMRYSMSWKNQNVSVEEEFSLIRSYVLLMNIINDFNINLCIDIDQDILSYQIPKMSIQPLVENAVNHGLEPKGTEGDISITAYLSEQTVIIEVLDNGLGIDEYKLQKIREGLESDNAEKVATSGKNGIGLLNVHKRINLFCGRPYGLTVDSKQGEYTKVVLHLPYEKGLGGW